MSEAAMTLKNVFMFVLLSGLLLARSTRPPEPEYSVLIIEYIGESDKPITPVLISDTKAGLTSYRETVLKGNKFKLISTHLVSTSLMTKLIAAADKYRGVGQPGPEAQPSFTESLSITMISPNKEIFLLKLEPSLSLLRDLKSQSRENKSLAAGLSHFEDRLVDMRK